MREPSQERSRLSTDRMLEAAIALLSEGGFAAVTIAAVAAESGASNGALYHRFHGRSGLIAAAQDRFLSRIEADLADALIAADRETDDLAALTSLTGSYLSLFVRNRRTFGPLIVEGRRDPVLRQRGASTADFHAHATGEWLTARFHTRPEAAESVIYALFALGSSRAIFDDSEVVERRTSEAEFARTLALGLYAIVTSTSTAAD